MPGGLPCFIDFEASSLADESYPIEIGWNDPEGNIESHLIRPHDDWTDWSQVAEETVHGISRADLRRHGREARWVLDRAWSCLRYQVVASDAPGFDLRWWRRLESAALRICPAFGIRDADDLYAMAACRRRCNTPACDCAARIQAAKDAAAASHPPTHRAAEDVGHLLQIWRLVVAGNPGP